MLSALDLELKIGVADDVVVKMAAFVAVGDLQSTTLGLVAGRVGG